MGIEQTTAVPAGSGPAQTDSSENTSPSSGVHEFANGESTTPRASRPEAPDQPHQSTPFAARVTNVRDGNRESKDSDTVNNNNKVAPHNRRSSHQVAGGGGQTEEIHQDSGQMVSNTVPSVEGRRVHFYEISHDYQDIEDGVAMVECEPKSSVILPKVDAAIKKVHTAVLTVQAIAGPGKLPELDKLVRSIEAVSTDLGALLKSAKDTGQEADKKSARAIANKLANCTYRMTNLANRLDKDASAVEEPNKKNRCLRLIGIALAVAGAAVAAVAIAGLLVFAPPVGIAAGAAVAAIGAALLIASYRRENRIADKDFQRLSRDLESACMVGLSEDMFFEQIVNPKLNVSEKFHQVVRKYANREKLNRDDMLTLVGELPAKSEGDGNVFPYYLNLRDANFSGADFSGMDFCNIDFTRANFTGADLKGASFKGVVMVAADLSGANLREASLVDVACNAANLSGANMTNANMERVDLDLAVLDGADVNCAAFTEVNFDPESLSCILSKTVRIQSCLLDGKVLVFRSADSRTKSL